MSREAPVRFREGLGVKLPRATRLLLGFAGPKKEAEAIRDQLAEYLKINLKLDLSIEKTLVTHAATEKAKFLGHELTALWCNTLIATTGNRTANGRISLLMPRKAVTEIRKEYSSQGKITHRPELEADDDHTIINRYQSVLRGVYNFYCMAVNVSKRMNRIKYILEISLTKTLAHKHRISVSRVYRKYEALNRVDNLKMLQLITPRQDKEPLIATFGGFPLKRIPDGLGNNDFRYEEAWFAPGGPKSEIVQRLLYGKCEHCGADDLLIVMHHIRKLADLDKPGRTPKATWQRIMSARKRKSLAVCIPCHQDIHAGRYDGRSFRKFTGEPCASKVASTVREGAAGKGDDL
jgi:hypothetical protein